MTESQRMDNRNLRELQSVVELAVAALAVERATPEQLREISGWATYEYLVGERNSDYTGTKHPKRRGVPTTRKIVKH